MQSANNTIFALSSGQGKSGVAVIRVSGADLDFLPVPQRPRFAKLIDFYGIDSLIAIYFKAPESFTGEDVVELHCHGGQAVIRAIFDKLRTFGFRMAERGEFSRRAFDNGKMDLVEVDGMRALIDARTESQRRRALLGIVGADSGVYVRWREQMIELAALSAARMDYDAGDLPKNIGERILKKTTALLSEVKSALQSKARLVESGFNVVLAGETNVGKSSLFNRLLGEGRAIVSDIAGTTRDVISAELDIDGYLVRLLDTAGLRESNDEIEKIGIEKTKEQVENADLVVRVFDWQNPGTKIGNQNPENEIIVVNKSDMVANQESQIAGRVYVSAKTGRGIGGLLDEIRKKLHAQLDGAENDLAVGERARAHLENAVAELEKSIDKEPDLQSEHIARAADELGLILGVIGTDEIYDSVFGQLCLGK
ncbi:MAG: tRNA uridine-5-carboxymethylaminomethyl(34) synthesis GTPase MnmE [Rickettsiales bacterium]|jgi:tRNA modification GTPase|nr:tRNA uridine-5-carboxymethylaminomethyl(34) synthesis GTPase MnmE [Rickettsiales bacterium]